MLETSSTFNELFTASSRRSEYRCTQIPGGFGKNNPNVTINQSDIIGEPILTQGYGDVEITVLGNIFVGSLSLRVRNTNFPKPPYSKNNTFQFEMRFTSTENPPETVSEWLPLGRYIVNKVEKSNRDEYTIEGLDACSVFEKFDIGQKLGTVPKIDLPTTYGGLWGRYDDMLEEYCSRNGLWRIRMPELPIEGVSPIKTINGMNTRETLAYLMAAWSGNMRADAHGNLVTARIRDLALNPPVGDVYVQEFSAGEQALPIGVVRLSGGRVEEVIYPEDSDIPTPADGISLFNYHSPWYTGGDIHTQRVYNHVAGYANKPFEAAVCFPNPAIEPGDAVTINGENYLSLYQQMKCGADPEFILACGALSNEKYRGSVEGRVESVMDGGLGEGSDYSGGVSGHFAFDHLPTEDDQDEIDGMANGSVVLVYDPNNPYVSTGG